MGNRRKSRELAMQALFYMDMNNSLSEDCLDRFCLNFSPSKKVRPFFLELVRGVMGGLAEIDALIKEYSKNWKISRMSCVDRNIIRIAIYEILRCADIPPKVTINEAVDIGKKYGTEDSGSFINGITDSVRISYEKKNLKTDIEKDSL